MASGDPPIIIKPGVYDDLMGVCITLDDSDQEWTITEQGGITTVTIPATAKWKVDRDEEDPNQLLIYIADKKTDQIRLINFDTPSLPTNPAKDGSRCEVDFSDIPKAVASTQPKAS